MLATQHVASSLIVLSQPITMRSVVRAFPLLIALSHLGATLCPCLMKQAMMPQNLRCHRLVHGPLQALCQWSGRIWMRCKPWTLWAMGSLTTCQMGRSS